MIIIDRISKNSTNILIMDKLYQSSKTYCDNNVISTVKKHNKYKTKAKHKKINEVVS